MAIAVRFPLRVVSLAALAGAVSVSSSPPAMLSAASPAIPPWSWATVPTYVHCSNRSGPLNDAILDVMATSSWVVLEKFMCVDCAPVAHGGEAKVLEAAAQIRARNPAAAVFFYFSVALARTWFTLGVWFDAHPELEVHNADGSLATVNPPFENSTWHVWGFGVPAAVTAWVDDVVQTVAKGNLQGVFIDGYRRRDTWAQSLIPKANASEQAAWLEGAYNDTSARLAAALPTSVRIANGGSELPAAYNAVSIEFFTPTNASIAQLEALAGTFVEVHGYVGNNSRLFALTLSTYLLGAQEGHYFGAGDTWDTCESWMVPAQLADYKRALGAPLAPAIRTGSRITRAFASGTTAELTVSAGGYGVDACVRWADGATTGTEGGC